MSLPSFNVTPFSSAIHHIYCTFHSLRCKQFITGAHKETHITCSKDFLFRERPLTKVPWFGFDCGFTFEVLFVYQNAKEFGHFWPKLI